MYWRWRRGKIGRSRYIEEKKKFKVTMMEIQKEKREREEEELKNMKREAEVWKYINKKRGAKRWHENRIEKEVWRRHFMELLEGEKLDGKQRKDLKERDGTIEEETKVIEEKEIRKAISKLKVRKTAEMNGIPMEAWKFEAFSWRRR